MRRFEYAKLEVISVINRGDDHSHYTFMELGKEDRELPPEDDWGLLGILGTLGELGWQMCGQRQGDFFFVREIEEDTSQFYYILFKKMYVGIEFHRLYKGTDAQYEIAKNVNNLRGDENSMRCSKKLRTIADVQEFIIDNTTPKTKDMNLTKLYNDPVYLTDTIS